MDTKTKKEMIKMNQEPINTPEYAARRQQHASTRSQERHERHMAKQAARAERRAIRAQKPRQDWTFEIHAGDQVYSFSWRWHKTELQSSSQEETRVEDSQAEYEPDASEDIQ
jgi:hypothetical protein